MLNSFTFFCISVGSFNTVAQSLKGEIVEPEQTPFARQQLSKHIPATTNTQATIEEMTFLCNGEVNTPLYR
jgi:hypothetical protein